MIAKPTYAELEQKILELTRVLENCDRSEKTKDHDKLILQSILQSPPSINIVCLDSSYRYLFFNNVHKEAVRAAWDAEIKTGANLLNYITNEKDRAAARMNFDRVLGGESFTLTQEFGEIQRNVWESTYNPIIGVGGQVNGLSVFSMDITKRWEAERLLKKSEKNYYDLYNTSPDMYVSVDAKTANVIACNQTLINNLGYTKDEIIGHPIFNLYTSECSKYAKANIFPVFLKTGRIDGEELHLERKDGSTIDVLLKVTAVRDSHGNILHSRSIWSDITKQKRSEENLRRLATVVKDSNDAITVQDIEGNITAWNKGAQKIFGYSETEALEMNIRDIVPDDKKEEALVFVQKLQEEELESFNTQRKTKDGRVLDVWLTVTRMLDDNGKIVGIATTERDITELKKAEKEKIKLESQLQQAQKMESIGTLAGGIAHDFNNILYPIIGFAEILKEDFPPDSPEHESAQEIFNAGIRGGELIKQILAFSRQSEHKMTPVRLQNIINEVLKLSRSTIPSNIKIEQNLQQNCGLVLADPTQIHQITMNLITNATHALENKNGVIDIELKELTLKKYGLPDSELQPGPHIKLSVSDNGIGMPKSTIIKVFEPYFTTKEKGKGTGLGLAVVYGIVKEHKGEIKVYSEVGKGTTFCIYLPLMKKETEAVSTEQISESATGTERILLVDDEVSVAKLESQMLSRLGYRITPETNSSDALNIFRSNPESFDLVITDMTMPDMTGDRLAKEMLSIKSDIPIIICTGFSERINKEQAETIGVKGFLMKPVVKSDMAQMVRKVLDEVENNEE